MASSWVSGKDRTKGLGAAVARILSSSFDGVARREGRRDSNQTSTSALNRQIARSRSGTKLRRPRRSHFLDRSPRLNPAGFSPDRSRQPGSRLGPCPLAERVARPRSAARVSSISIHVGSHPSPMGCNESSGDLLICPGQPSPQSRPSQRAPGLTSPAARPARLVPVGNFTIFQASPNQEHFRCNFVPRSTRPMAVRLADSSTVSTHPARPASAGERRCSRCWRTDSFSPSPRRSSLASCQSPATPLIRSRLQRPWRGMSRSTARTPARGHSQRRRHGNRYPGGPGPTMIDFSAFQIASFPDLTTLTVDGGGGTTTFLAPDASTTTFDVTGPDSGTSSAGLHSARSPARSQRSPT